MPEFRYAGGRILESIQYMSEERPPTNREQQMLSKDVNVEAFWDEEARVWVASSNDVPGLITEADTMEHLMQKLRTLIPELLHANGLLNDPGVTIDIPIHLLGKWQEVIKFQLGHG